MALSSWAWRSSRPAAPRGRWPRPACPCVRSRISPGFPEMMDGRVKTLHPRLYAGLLAVRDNDEHLRAAAEHEIEPVDLVCVNLYPFEQTVARGDATPEEIVENIDIGGPTMIRAAAKNSAFAAVLVDPADYAAVLAELARGGRSPIAERSASASRARRLPAPRATTPRSPPGSRSAQDEDFPRAAHARLREGGRAALRREPAPARRLLRRGWRAHAPARGCQYSCTARSCRSTTCST